MNDIVNITPKFPEAIVQISFNVALTEKPTLFYMFYMVINSGSLLNGEKI